MPIGPIVTPQVSATREIGVGLLGLGNVGAGVIQLVTDNAAAIEARLGARVVVRRVAVRDPARSRLVAVDPAIVTSDAASVIADPSVDVVVELVGGSDAAREYVLAAIARRRHVVTANKALLAVCGDELFAAADAAGVDIYYEAAVCGGLPIIRALREGLASDRIHALYGIVNGTSNFILSTMTQEGKSFEAALLAATEAGYAEADPSLDVDGLDAAHKLVILAMLCFGTRVRLEEVHVEGIRGLTPVDFAFAERFGYVVKPLVIAKDYPDGIDARVHPALIPRSWLLAAVAGVHNAVYVTSHALGHSMYYGRGAGMMPTAVAVVSDVIEVARNTLARAAGAAPSRAHGLRRWADRPIRDMGRLVSRYYLRFTVADRPGALGELAGVLGGHNVSIAQVVQEGTRAPDRAATVVVLTHAATERDVNLALAQIDRLHPVAQPTQLLRIVE